MGQSWLPLKDADLLSFMQNMSAKITATPTDFGLQAADATALAALLTSYEDALAAASDPATRTPVSVTAKDVAEARSLAKRIQATPTVTPDQKSSLGLPIHKTTVTPIPAPLLNPSSPSTARPPA